MLLAGDIGGTKSALALFDPASGPRIAVRRAEYPSQHFSGLDAVVQEFLHGDTRGITGACFGVAGPVLHGRAEATNLPWTMDEAVLGAELGLPAVLLLNDVQATAAAIPLLHPEETDTVIEGAAAAGGTIALVAAGTGLGEAFLVWDGRRYQPQPSEGGHADFAPSDAEQIALLAYMQQSYRHVSYERVCSGIGLPHIYDFLRDTGRAEETAALAEQLRFATDRTRGIIEAASDQHNPLCVQAVEMFGSILAAEASNLALKVLATGGVYLAGGIPRAILPSLRAHGFRDAFSNKGRLSDLVARIPVRVITGDAALLGAAIVALESWPDGR